MQLSELPWDAVSDVTTKNVFNKAELPILESGADEEVDLMAVLMCSFNALNIPIDENAIEESVHIDDEDSEEFLHKILDDVNEVFVKNASNK